MGILKNRRVEVRVVNDKDQEVGAIAGPAVEPVDISKIVQDTSRIVASHAIVGVATYVLLDTFRQVIVKIVPGH